MRRLSLRLGLESALSAFSWFALSALLVASLPAEVNASPAAEALASSTLEDNLKRQGLISKNVDQPSSIASGCVSNPFPTQPSRASYSAEFTDTTFSNGNRFRLTAWREPCANDPLRSAVFVRYTILTGSSVFVCGAGGSLQAFQNGTLYNSILEVWRYSATSNYLNYFCGSITSAQTFLIDQWVGIYANFDDQNEFTVRYGYNDANRLTIPAYTPNAVRRTLSVQLTGTGQGQVNSSPSGIACTSGTCRAEFYEGTTVTLTAIPSGAARFAGWGGACSGTATTVRITISSDATCTAQFNPPRTLSIQITGSGTGRVTSSPSGIACTSGTCRAEFSEGTTVTLTATPSGAARFAGWGGACSGTATTVRITISADATCTARFNPPPVNPESGWWWASAEPGRGYSLELKNGRLFISSYAYRADGSPVWYLSSGSWDGQSLTTSLDEYEGGQTLFGDWRTAALRGTATTATLTFSSSTRGTLIWPDGRTTSIERFLFGATAQADVIADSEPKPARPPLAEISEASALEAKVASIGRVRVIIGFNQGTGIASAQSDSVARSLASTGSQLHYTLRSLPMAVATVSGAGLEALRSDPRVSFIQEDKIDGLLLTSSAPKIGADRAWASGATGQGQAIAVLDSGVDAAHPFIGGSVFQEACFSTTEPAYTATSNCPGGGGGESGTQGLAKPQGGEGPGTGTYCTSVPSSCLHGTHVAGIAAGRGAGMSGIAPQARLISVQVFTTFTAPEVCGDASPCIGSFNSDQLRALEWVRDRAVEYGIASVNMSLGGGRYSTYCDTDARKPVIDQLRALGVATVIATGNEYYGSSVASPACISTAIRVGATTLSDTVPAFTNEWSLPMLVAPGVSIRSSVPGGGFAALSGTSMATPHVAGAWAALKSLRPTASVDRIYQLINSSARAVRGVYTYPRLDVGVASDQLLAIETGWWWNPSEPGRGFFVEVQRGTLFLSVFGYGDDQRSVWHIANGQYSRGVFQANLMEFGGGQALGGSWRQPSMIADRGTITMQPLGDGRIQATLSNGRQLMLSRFSF